MRTNPATPPAQPNFSAWRGGIARAAHNSGASATQPSTKPHGCEMASHHDRAVAAMHTRRTRREVAATSWTGAAETNSDGG
jgi:hypothetical protein